MRASDDEVGKPFAVYYYSVGRAKPNIVTGWNKAIFY
jgi:hypothetical protein